MFDMVFIGDRVTAAGFRLAGIPSFSPAPDELAATVSAERARCRILALTAEMFAALPGPLAEQLQDAHVPLLAVIPDARDRIPVPDMDLAVRRALGIEV
ncbi:V-type ATP synthase subunit F [Mesobacterium sp. TK19101]|uniref:V-type ATP synthase subunit F n=1 Tax=Mesobacterium hydrothermale TaxID=3111907 RepID=A0ABU6HK07_9RHOB|nr:V-type ATP synthase subunit F [Mesobacterium sp. TK19101]MEC3862784.1 V-type ATP synthase subunit F [Mesobacterium sp. TK19101]